MLPLLAFPAVFFTIGTGQNAFLTAALFAAAILLVDRRPLVAGLLFGALCYKPHFGLLVPVALAAGGRWRSFAAAAASVAALVGLSVLAFGWDTWRAFLDAVPGSHAVYEMRITRAGMASPFGTVLVLGGSPVLAYEVQAVATLTMAVAVGWVWRRGMSLPIRAAILAAATPLAVPVVLFYDLMLTGIALAWLVRAVGENGFPAWGKAAMVILFAATLLSGNFDPGSHLLIAPLIAAGGFVLAVAAAAREAAGGAISCYAASPRMIA
jgi:alpha-1,2-mannosyltransferase